MNEKVILSKVKRFCSAVAIVATVLIVVAYCKEIKTLGVFACGILFPALFVECIANPIENEEDE